MNEYLRLRVSELLKAMALRPVGDGIDDVTPETTNDSTRHNQLSFHLPFTASLVHLRTAQSHHDGNSSLNNSQLDLARIDIYKNGN